jgi:hypothetical protein
MIGAEIYRGIGILPASLPVLDSVRAINVCMIRGPSVPAGYCSGIYDQYSLLSFERDLSDQKVRHLLKGTDGVGESFWRNHIWRLVTIQAETSLGTMLMIAGYAPPIFIRVQCVHTGDDIES